MNNAFLFGFIVEQIIDAFYAPVYELAKCVRTGLWRRSRCWLVTWLHLSYRVSAQYADLDYIEGVLEKTELIDRLPRSAQGG